MPVTPGINLLTRIVEDCDSTAFNDLDLRYLTDKKEQDLQAFVEDHYSTYNKLPSFDTLIENGYKVSKPKEDLEYYLKIVRKRFLHNKLAPRSNDLATLLSNRDYESAEEIINEMVGCFTDYKTSDLVQDYVDTALPQLIERYKKSKTLTGLSGLSFGYSILDEMTDGAQKEEVYVFAARPSVGKTQTLINIADNMWQSGKNVLFVSMEMSKQEITNRLTARHMGINPKLLRRADVSVFGENRLYQLPDRLRADNKFRILAGDMEKKTSDIENAVRELKPDVVFIDASYLLEPRNKTRYTAQHELIGQVIKDIKKLATGMHVPICVSVQFNRQVKKKTKTDLDIGYLAGSDQIGQIAALVIGITHGDVPYEDTTRKYTVLKNRHGGEHVEFYSNFNYESMDFSQYDKEEEEPEETEFGIKDEEEINILV